MSDFPWSALGIDATGDARAIRSAYAARIKSMDLDADVDGYALLRQARDQALRLAKGMAPPPVEAEPDVEEGPIEPGEDSAPPTWRFSALTLDGEWAADLALSAPAPAATDQLIDRISPDLSAKGGPGSSILPANTDSFAAPLLEGRADGGDVSQEALQSPFARLSAMLDTSGPAGVAPMDRAEETRALTILRAVLDVVYHSNVTRQDEMEAWLLDMFVDAWPRSGPLVEEANTVFAWDREWDKVDARPAVAYLGTHLRAHRFHAKVQRPEHRFHKAWTELRRPGRAGPLRALSANGADVRQLLAGIRKRFPELEDHLDADRIASWEGGSAWPTVAIALLALALLSFLASLGDSAPRPSSAPNIVGGTQFAADMRTIHAANVEAVAETFGAGHDPGWLRQQDSSLSVAIENLSRAAVQSGEGNGGAANHAVEFVRRRLYLNGRATTGEDFERTMRLRLDLLKAAQAKDTATCLLYLNAGQLPAAVPVPWTVRTRERELAASFAERGLLGQPALSGPTTASVPGALVANVIAATKLPKADVAQAMQGKGPDTNRCAVSIALLKATLG
ncbi:hypothetical protein [Novosphingobium sp. AP12]|uniref:hypothetical protein n=1 Tax=Novosphingobium sp. AP12 TaxID=1144305 RepID=UPI000271F603|nr:hypothetical protein [Novosphingobium sp. AP12]EJL31157.1 hypothetical protein PMI02_01830 [Novosphingobium sp. AP12]